MGVSDAMGLLLPQALGFHAAARPDEVAFQQVDGPGLTWGEANDASLRLADAFERWGIEAGEPVVSMLPNTVEAILSWVGCSWLRAIEAPINTAYKGAWLTHAINLTGARLAIVERRFLPNVIEVAPELDDLQTIVVVGADDGEEPLQSAAAGRIELRSAADFMADSDPRPRPGGGPEPWDLAALIFTSGTTGRSKAVMVPWGQFQDIRRIDWGQPLGPKVHYSPFAPYHVTGKGPIFSAATDGGRAILRDGFSTDAFWADIRTHGITNMVMMGPMAQFLLAQPPRADDTDHSLEFVLMGPVIPEVDEFRARFGVDVLTCYNMTEINAPVTATGRQVTAANHRSCGRIRAGVEVRIVDEHDCEVPPNTPGEMIVRSEPWTLNAGYWGMPDKTVEAWRNGWFHTGDTFTCDEDGYLYFVDRAKDYIRRRGENISSFEVERCVDGHPDIVESAAVSVPSADGEDEVKIAVVVAPERTIDPAELIAYLVPRMPRFAIPRYVDVVPGLPKTQATQRIQKAEIRAAGVTTTTWDRIAAGVELPTS